MDIPLTPCLVERERETGVLRSEGRDTDPYALQKERKDRGPRTPASNVAQASKQEGESVCGIVPELTVAFPRKLPRAQLGRGA